MTPPEAGDCDVYQDLLGPYALDAVDPEEAALVERHLESCPRCRQEVDRHRETVGLLAATGGPAPTQVWDRIADTIGRPASPDQPAPPELSTARLVPPVEPSARPRWVRPLQAAGLAAAAAVVVLLALGTARIANLDHQVHQLTAASRQANGGLANALVDPDARHMTLTTTAAGRPIGQLIILPSGESYLVGSALPALASTRTYQLWSMAQGRAVSISLLGAHPSTVAFRVDPGAPPRAYAITIEPAGGVVSPTTSPIAQATATA